MSDTAPHRGRLVVAAVAVVALGAGALANRVSAAPTIRYRTVAVDAHDIESVLTGVATLEPTTQASVAFPVSGTVAAVDVAVGDSVGVGQSLAALDTGTLTDTLHDKEATLAQARLTLEKALAGEAVTGSSPARGASATDRAVITPAAFSAAGAGDVARAQQAVLAAQQRVDQARAVADQALSSAALVCDRETPPAPATPGTTAPAPAADGTLTACRTALTAVQSAQQDVAGAQAALAGAMTALDGLLAEEARPDETTTPPTTAPRSGSGSSSNGSSSGPSNGSSSGSGSATAPSAADLVAYQRAVDAAEADVAVADQAVAQARIVSPMAGTVAAVHLTTGQAVAVGSATATVVVVGPGGVEATTLVSVTDLSTLKVGQPATVVPDGRHDPLRGEIVGIAVSPASSSGTTSYRVVIGFEGDHPEVGNGSTGTVSIVTAAVTSALSVPTSAVTNTNGTHTVSVLDGETTATPVTVQVGTIGATWTEIKGGLTAGQRVVLADLDQALPGSATATNGATNGNGNRNLPGGGAFPGAGGFNGGGRVASGGPAAPR